MGLKVATSTFMSGGVMVISGLRTSYSLSKKTASGLGVVRAVHQGAKDYGFKNIAKAQMKTAFTGDYAKGNTKATAKINQWFNDK